MSTTETPIVADPADAVVDVVAAAADGSVPTNAAAGDKKKRRDDRPKKDERPIEEIFDLTKPIPRVEKPNKEEFDKKLQEISDEIEVLKVSRAKVQETIESTMAEADAKSGKQDLRTKMAALKTTKNALIEEKKTLRTQLDALKSKTDSLLKEKKDTKSNVRFGSLEEIDAEIKRLQTMQETTSMSIPEENKLIRNIDSLIASKRFFVDLKSTDASIDDVKEQKKNMTQAINSKDKEIDEIAKEIKVITDSLDVMNQSDSKKRDGVNALFKERDELKKQMTAKIAEKDKLRDENRLLNDAYYLNQRAVKKQKQMQYEEEKRKREEEKAVYLAKLEEEELKKIPYEEEQALCEFLADYLERTYLKKAPTDDTAAVTKAVEAVVIDDSFKGMVAKVKKNEEEEEFMVMGGKGSKKKRNRPAKKQDALAGPFTLSVDTFEQFGLLQLNPPISLDQVEASVKELREKKEWYKNQPRGSVPTAAEIRKAARKNEAESTTTTKNYAGSNGAGTKKKSGGGKAFSLSSDDFVPLGASTGTAAAPSFIASSWGRSAAPTVSDATPTPAEAEQE